MCEPNMALRNCLGQPPEDQKVLPERTDCGPWLETIPAVIRMFQLLEMASCNKIPISWLLCPAMRIPASISTKSVALLLFLAHCPSPEGWNIQPYGRLNDPELVESSGADRQSQSSPGLLDPQRRREPNAVCCQSARQHGSKLCPSGGPES